MFWELGKKANCVCSTINAQGLFISLFWLSPAANIIQLNCWHCPKLHTNCRSTPHNYFFLVCDESGQPPEAIVAIRTQDLFDIPHGCSQQYKVEYIKQSSEPSAI